MHGAADLVMDSLYSVTCQSLSYNTIPFYNNHLEASITTKLLLVYS